MSCPKCGRELEPYEDHSVICPAGCYSRTTLPTPTLSELFARLGYDMAKGRWDLVSWGAGWER